MGMWDVLQWVIVAGAGGVVSIITQVLFIKPNKRIKEAEAASAEFEQLEKQIEHLNKRIDGLYKDLGKSEEEKRQSRRELEISEVKRYKLKSCISRAHNCRDVDNCPVLQRQRELEEEWIRESKGNENES
jgi:septal ring factor EnvC (AmiA/AmiB activator)